MKKREFQQKATAVLLKKIADVSAKLSTNPKINGNERCHFAPNIEVRSKNNCAYFKLRISGYQNLNLIDIAVKQTGELSYILKDECGETGGSIIYYRYGENDNHEAVIKKFADDMGRMYKDFLTGKTLHGFWNIQLSYDISAADALKEYENYMM